MRRIFVNCTVNSQGLRNRLLQFIYNFNQLVRGSWCVWSMTRIYQSTGERLMVCLEHDQDISINWWEAHVSGAWPGCINQLVRGSWCVWSMTRIYQSTGEKLMVCLEHDQDISINWWEAHVSGAWPGYINQLVRGSWCVRSSLTNRRRRCQTIDESRLFYVSYHDWL